MALKGLDWYKRRLQTFVDKFPEAVGDAMYQEASVIANLSQAQCPVDSGTLRRSFMMVQVPDKARPKVQLSYGTDYAVYVHERMGAKHPVGKAKFLEDPINEMRDEWLRLVWRRVNANFKAVAT